MANKKILILPGDGPGPSVMAAAEKVLKAAAPGIDIIHGEIGRTAWEHTSKVLPAPTADMIAVADAILSGPADISGIGGRDPFCDIKRQLHLCAEISEFRTLCGGPDTDLLFVNQCSDAATPVRENEVLDGVVSEIDTEDDSLTELFGVCMSAAERAGRNRVCLVGGTGLFASSEKHMLDCFRSCFAGSGFKTETMSAEEAACGLVSEPGRFDVIVSGRSSRGYLRGILTGLVGGSGIIPVSYIGGGKGLFMPSRVFGDWEERRSRNPTSAMLAAASLLRFVGEEEGYITIQRAVENMYLCGHTMPGIGGGDLSPEEFTAEILERVQATMIYHRT